MFFYRVIMGANSAGIYGAQLYRKSETTQPELRRSTSANLPFSQ